MLTNSDRSSRRIFRGLPWTKDAQVVVFNTCICLLKQVLMGTLSGKAFTCVIVIVEIIFRHGKYGEI